MASESKQVRKYGQLVQIMMFEARSTFTIDDEEIQNPTSLAFILQTTLVNLEFFMPSQVERLANDLLFTCLKVID